MRAADGVIRLLRGEIAGFRFSYGVLFLLSVERKCGISFFLWCAILALCGERLRDFVFGVGCFPCFPDFCISLYILWKKGCGGYFVFMAGYGTIVARGFI